MKLHRKPLFVACAGVLLAATTPLPAFAQGGAGLEEIIVTAQRHEESLQETPIAITAFSARDLENQRVTNIMHLLNKVPSLALAPWAGSRVTPNLFIRGMGNLNTQSTNDMATGIYMDGVPVGRGVGLAADIADLERVEVLRGPQGTLWGRNTTAGAINFVTKRPDADFGGKLQLTAGSFQERGVRANLNAPVTDGLYTRIAYMRTENDGWVKNNSPLPKQINFNEDRKKEAVKLAVRYEPTDEVTVDYGYDQSEMVYGNHFYQVVQAGSPFFVPGRQRHATPRWGMKPSSTEVGGHNLTLTWDLGDVTLKSISAYRDLDSKIDMNFADAFTQDRRMEQDQFSQELQAIGEACGGCIKYVAGVFYMKEDADESLSSDILGGVIRDYWTLTAKSDSKAIYGQVTWTPAILEERLDLTLGARYTEDSREATKIFQRADLTPDRTGMVVNGDRDFTSTDPMVTVAYRFTDNVNGFAKYSTGYRAGGFNAQSTPQFFGEGYKPEEVKAWEVGLKSELLDNRVRLNLALFRNKYDDLQVDQSRVPAFFVDTINAGSTTIEGFELEATAVVTDGLSFNLFYSHLDAVYDSYVDNGVELASVRHVANSPDWQGGVGMEYEFLRSSFGNVTLNVDYRAQDSFYAGPKADTYSGGYEVWNARVELSDVPLPYGALRVALWSRNLGDQVYRLSTTNLGANRLSAQFGQPRTSGVDVVYEF
ncbi:MAG: TonB-dependent receptor [Pseudomonadales bacterium]|jgi:iron complex outermembrane receptor protein|nr:TonB-dependent receptor [Pseudomonadales bacterium]MCP5321314.1 TonB-dependent receptor [Pseudomonadales bacterium]MCP5336228.1 TonB-dependent receptor [Pseudomonadales bacterium]